MLCIVVVMFRGILRLDMRARQDVALIGSGFLKLDGTFFILPMCTLDSLAPYTFSYLQVYKSFCVLYRELGETGQQSSEASPCQ